MTFASLLQVVICHVIIACIFLSRCQLYAEPKTCSLERFRAMLGVDCDDAIITANILGLSLFGIIMLTALILVKRRYAQPCLPQ